MNIIQVHRLSKFLAKLMLTSQQREMVQSFREYQVHDNTLLEGEDKNLMKKNIQAVAHSYVLIDCSYIRQSNKTPIRTLS